MSDDVLHPRIDPSQFDLAVVGTGLPESIIAAASAAAGKSVLHLDPNSFYGSDFSSLSLDDFVYFLKSQQEAEQHSHSPTSSHSNCENADYAAVNLKSHSLYSDIEISSPGSTEDLGPSRKFSLDLCGPRVLFCADSIINLMLKSGASHHVEFKSIDASLIYCNDGKFSTVPDSRSAIFKDRSLSPIEKNQLMRFFKLVQAHFNLNQTTQEDPTRISNEDLERPFIDFLTKQRLPQKLKTTILYAIAMADYDQQDNPESCENLVKTKDGIECLALYHSSVGRFTNALGALIYPLYGQGELPQAFCRCAAVKGSLYVLRMSIKDFLLDKESRQYKGLRLGSGQEVFSNQLVMGPSFTVPDSQQERPDESTLKDGVKGQVARAVCITNASIMSDSSNLLIIFPPRSLSPEQIFSVRALQLGSSLAVCPSGLFVTYLSVLCDDVAKGKESLHAAIKALLSGSHESVEETTTSLLWSAMYIQQLTKVSSDGIILCPTPDGNISYKNILESTEKLFHQMYPDDEFMSETNASEDIANDSDE